MASPIETVEPILLEEDDIARADALRGACHRLLAECAKVIVGQEEVLEQLLLAVLAKGHCLLVGVPGLAKTLMIHTLADGMALTFNRVQFTPDLMPTDITGTELLYDDRATGAREFRFVQGPIFSNIVLADEINRTPPKTQAALLEAMQERQVTVAGKRHRLPDPFFVLATQNPIEQEGTNPLPEAQLDRFMLKVLLDYPTKADEAAMLVRMGSVDAKTDIPPALSAAGLSELRGVVDATHLDPAVADYLLDVVRATRVPKEYGLDLAGLIEFGASPRASLSLVRAAKAHAFLAGRGYVVPDDVKLLAPDVLRHRVIVSYEAEAEDLKPDDLIRRILDHLPVP